MPDRTSLFNFFNDKRFNTCYFCEKKTKYVIETITLATYSPNKYVCQFEKSNEIIGYSNNSDDVIKLKLNDDKNYSIDFTAHQRLFMFYASCSNEKCGISSIRTSFLNDNVLHYISELLSFDLNDKLILTVVSDFGETELIYEDSKDETIIFTVDRIPITFWKNHSVEQLKKKIEKLKLLK